MKRTMLTLALAGAALAASGNAFADSRNPTDATAGHLADESIGQAVSSGAATVFSGTGDSLGTATSAVGAVGDSLS